MACACKVNQQIGYLQKHYGEKMPQSKKTHMAMTPFEFLLNLLTLLIVVVALPIMFVGVLLRAITGKTNIKLTDTFFGLKYVRRTK